jgi:DNA-binding NarL/FixJ family response regulator
MIKIKFGIIEDNINVTEVVKNYLTSFPEFDFMFSMHQPEYYTKFTPAIQKTEVILCDIGLPKINGIQMVWNLKQLNPDVKILMFTVFEDDENIFKAIKAGANGYILKNTSLPKLKEAILEVASGDASMSPKIAAKVLNHFRNPKLKSKEIEKLTEREIEITELLYQGDKYKTISEKLFISVDTVKYHVKNIFLKLQITSRSELPNKFY